MLDRAVQRARDIKDTIRAIHASFGKLTYDDVFGDVVKRAALERFLEIISEASRFLPDDWKIEHGPDIPWRQVAALGNVLRHAYKKVDAGYLWSIYQDDLPPLEAAIDAMLAAHRKPAS